MQGISPLLYHIVQVLYEKAKCKKNIICKAFIDGDRDSVYARGSRQVK